jgi:hypothetical protein
MGAEDGRKPEPAPRDDGERRVLQVAAVVLLFMVIGFLALGMYYFFSSISGVAP